MLAVAGAGRPRRYGRPIAEGTWLYSGSVRTPMRIVESDVAFGSGDDEDEPEVAHDRPSRWFYVEWEPAGGGPGGSRTGPFTTLDEAKTHAEQVATGVRWDVEPDAG